MLTESENVKENFDSFPCLEELGPWDIFRQFHANENRTLKQLAEGIHQDIQDDDRIDSDARHVVYFNCPLASDAMNLWPDRPDHGEASLGRKITEQFHLGLHPLAQVLDLAPRKPARPGEAPVRMMIELADDEDPRSEFLNSNGYRLRVNNLDECRRFLEEAAKTQKTLSDLDSRHHFVSAYPHLVAHLIASVVELCHDTEIDNSHLNHIAILGGILDSVALGDIAFEGGSGEQFLTLQRRPHALGISLGVHAFHHEQLTDDHRRRLTETIVSWSAFANRCLLEHSLKIEGLVKEGATNFSTSRAHVKTCTTKLNNLLNAYPRKLDNYQETLDPAIEIAAIILGSRPQSGHKIVSVIQRFLVRASLCCELKNEGRNLEYGLLLADPFSVRYWPGSKPVPCTRLVPDDGGFAFEWPQNPVDNGFFPLSISAIFEHIEATENPRHNCIVFPYGGSYQHNAPDADSCPAYVLSLLDYHRAVSASPMQAMWGSTSGVYAQLTETIPGAIAALVGPGSLIRLFMNGNLVAFRDGRGWLFKRQLKVEKPTLSRTATHLSDAWSTLVDESSVQHRIDRVLDVVQHLSPRLQPRSHGGFVVYVPDEEVAAKIVSSEQGYTDAGSDWRVNVQMLHRGEMPRLSPREMNWVTGFDLLDGDSALSINAPVARLMLRCAEHDGAILLAGPNCRIVQYGLRVNVEPISESAREMYGSLKAYGGTKRVTSAAVAIAAGTGAFAVAVSSDGPIRLFVNNGQGGEVFADKDDLDRRMFEGDSEKDGKV